jgi:hypothetical protein
MQELQIGGSSSLLKNWKIEALHLVAGQQVGDAFDRLRRF